MAERDRLIVVTHPDTKLRERVASFVQEQGRSVKSFADPSIALDYLIFGREEVKTIITAYRFPNSSLSMGEYFYNMHFVAHGNIPRAVLLEREDISSARGFKESYLADYLIVPPLNDFRVGLLLRLTDRKFNELQARKWKYYRAA